MKLIVGLGNPGRSYAHNRHNVGFRCVNYFARVHSIPIKRQQCQARIGIGEVAGIKLLLAKPRTFVNLSGNSVKSLLRKYNISIDDLLVVCDDLDLPLGKIRLRSGGSSGGHKGFESIISALGSGEFSRVRVGIGRPAGAGGNEDIIVGYVLSDFTSQEAEVVKSAIVTAADAIYCVLTQGIVAAMNEFN